MNNGLPPTCAQCLSCERHRVIRRAFEDMPRNWFANAELLQFSEDPSVPAEQFGKVEISTYKGKNHLDLQAIARPDASYDWVVCNHVLEHVQDDKKAMRELLRIVKSDGMLVFSYPSPLVCEKTNDWGYAKENVAWHYRTYGRDAITARFAEAFAGWHVLSYQSEDPVTNAPDICYFATRDQQKIADLRNRPHWNIVLSGDTEKNCVGMQGSNSLKRNTCSIPVFLSSNDKYSPLIATCAYSILSNTKRRIDFYVMDGGISENSKKLVEQSLGSFYNFTMRYVNMSLFELERFPSIGYFSVNAYSRFFIPEIAPHLGKAIYLDIDTIIVGDIAELYEQNLENYPLGAGLSYSSEHSRDFFRRKVFPNFSGNMPFNSGVLLLDIQKFITNDYVKKLIEITIEYSDRLYGADQDIFNIVFDKNFKVLSPRFNFVPAHLPLIRKLNLEWGGDCAAKNPLVIHYVGKWKPWNTKSIPGADKFWEIAPLTAFHDQLLLNYKTPYF